MPPTTALRARRVRPNRVADLAYLVLTVLIQAAAFQVWEFAIRQVFWTGGVGAMASASVFPIATFALYTRLALGKGPMVVHSLALSVLVHPIPTLLPLFGLQTLAAGLVGGFSLRETSRRGSVVTAGALAGLASAVVFATTAVWTLPINTLVTGVVGAFLGGVLAGAAVLALSPIAERVFGHVTPLTLLESLSYDHPLLSRLVTTAPGTFLHSTNVAVLCDAGARAICADALTTRVAALYHDSGKTNAPHLFFENQSELDIDGQPPDAVRDALLAHVTDGVKLVRAHGFGERIADFVREHHGTTEMRSLIDRAQMAGERDLSSYRYPGPRPRSRESGLLMIADRLEATARTRPLRSKDDCLSLAREVVDQILAEEQLVHSGLTDEDLDQIEQVLGDVLYAVYHHRVGYREPAYTPPRLRAVGASRS